MMAPSSPYSFLYRQNQSQNQHRRDWRRALRVLFCTFCFWLSHQPSLYAAPPTPVAPTSITQAAAQAASLQQLTAAADGAVTISTHPTTGAVHFVRVSNKGDLLPTVAYDQNRQRAVQLTEKSADFFGRYGTLFGLTDPTQALQFRGERTDAQAFSHLTYQQYDEGVPVFGGTLRTHFDAAGNLTAVNGVAVPMTSKVSTTPQLTVSAAGAVAIAAIQAENPTPDQVLRVATNQLYIFQPELLKGRNGPLYLAYRVEIVNATYSVRRFVFVDAHSGKPLLTLNGIHELEREISEGSLGNKKWDEGSGNPDPIPSGWASGSAAQITAWNDEIAGAKESYNLFGSLTNGTWLSYDGKDAVMRTVNNDPTISCPNANWNGISTNYCDGVTGDDTVAHEWGHAYTEYTNNLIYRWQPGALNESYSDIWGEVVDLLNSRGQDLPNTLRTVGSCSTFGAGTPKNDNSYRWLSGEDDPAFNGAIRDMWHPACYGDPGKVSDTGYTCDVEFKDDGGVHINSGVPNHLFALLVDGGTYNNVTVSAIGLTRAAHIHWRAQSVYETEVSDFFDHAEAITAACTDLIGQPLHALTTSGPGSWGVVAPEMISTAHCTAVANAIAAVELRTPPSKCDLTPLLNPAAPALCTAPTVPTNFHQQSWENGLEGWTVGRRAVAKPAQFDIPNWSVIGSLPDQRTGQAAFGPDPLANGDQCQTIDESGVIYLQSPQLTVPAYATAPRLVFDHWIATEPGFDGGNLKIRVNGGVWTIVATNALSFNSYNTSLIRSNANPPNTNPMAGEPAFTGSNNSSVRGSWGQTQVNLSSYARPGDKVELRFEMGLDECAGLVGWYVDDVRAYACTLPPDVTIAKQASTATALPGQPVTYQLTATNLNPLPASDLVVTDQLPNGVTIASFTPGGTVTPNPTPRVVWSFSALEANAQKVLTVTAVISPALSNDLTLTNTALVTASNDASAANNTATNQIAVTVPRVSVGSPTLRIREDAGQVPVTITLNVANPYAPIKVTYATANSSAKPITDYLSASNTVTITAGSTTAVLPITVVNDALPEQDELFRVVLTTAEGAKVTQDTVEITILNDDIPGVTLKPAANRTGEDGTTTSMTVTLTAQPTAPVTVTLSSSDPTEGIVTPQLIFTPQNWNVPQTALASGVDDPVDDGNVAYQVTAALSSTDALFAAVTPVAVTLTNVDNEMARLTVVKTVAAPSVTLGSVVTYSYAITNSGNVTISQISAVDNRLGAVPLSLTTLAPNASVRSQLTHTLVISDLPVLINTVTATGLSIDGNQIVGTAQATVKLLNVEIVLTKRVGIEGITPICATTDTLHVPAGTKVRYCYTIENRGAIPLLSHRLVDNRLGQLLNNAAIALTPGATYSTSMTTTLSVTTTNVATWTSSFLYTTTVAQGVNLTRLLEISANDAVTVTVASATDDSDGDTIPDNIEGAKDIDSDNKPNFLDTDADNDGLSDQSEAGPDPRHPRDGNGNGVPDYLEASPTSATKRLFLPIIFR